MPEVNIDTMAYIYYISSKLAFLVAVGLSSGASLILVVMLHVELLMPMPHLAWHIECINGLTNGFLSALVG